MTAAAPGGGGGAERFARFALIDWWEQERLAAARVVVVGAGALGNEVVKNCALLGIGHLVIADFDRIEVSNLSRAPLFRTADAGSLKAVVAARAARELHPEIAVTALCADVAHDVGLGLWRWADVVIGAVDNREARLVVNRGCYRVGTPWIDGAIEALSGVARVFVPPDGPCYECTMSALDWKLLDARRSCSLLARNAIAAGHVPTTPTTASVIAGIECQEALKLLHGRATLAGAGFRFDGDGHTSDCVTYVRSPDCLSHVPPAPIHALPRSCADTSLRTVLDQARDALGPQARLELGREILLALACSRCERVERRLTALSRVSESDAPCPECGEARAPVLLHSIDGSEDFLDRTLAAIGVPPWDIVWGCAGESAVGFELSEDRATVLAGGAP